MKDSTRDTMMESFCVQILHINCITETMILYLPAQHSKKRKNYFSHRVNNNGIFLITLIPDMADPA